MVYCNATSAVSFMAGAVSFMVGAGPTVGTDSVRLRGRYILCVVRRFFEMSFFWSSRVARRYWPFRIDAALAEVRPNTRGIAQALVAKSSEVLGHVLISGLLAERLRAYFGTGDTEEGDADLSQSVDDGFIKLAFRGISGEASLSLSDMGKRSAMFEILD